MSALSLTNHQSPISVVARKREPTRKLCFSRAIQSIYAQVNECQMKLLMYAGCVALAISSCSHLWLYEEVMA